MNLNLSFASGMNSNWSKKTIWRLIYSFYAKCWIWNDRYKPEVSISSIQGISVIIKVKALGDSTFPENSFKMFLVSNIFV